MTPRLLLALPLLAMACTQSDPTPPRSMPPEDIVDACVAAELQDLVGQPAAVATAITFAVPVRIIEPGMAVTMDFNPQRLNIEIGEGGLIARIFCG
jgi:hypothetical protein